MWRDVVAHFVKKGVARQTIYNVLNRRKWSINTTRESCRSPFILDVVYEGKVKETRKQPKRSNSAKVGWEIRQASNDHKQANKKIGISNYMREKTPKYNEETALKVQKKSRKQVNLLYKSRTEVIMYDEK